MELIPVPTEAAGGFTQFIHCGKEQVHAEAQLRFIDLVAKDIRQPKDARSSVVYDADQLQLTSELPIFFLMKGNQPGSQHCKDAN
jgi:hypothetical protein